MTVIRRLTDLLKRPELTQINFHVHNTLVYGTGFRVVSNLITQRRVTVRPRSREEEARASSHALEAEYNHVSNELIVPDDDDWPQLEWDRGIVIHEAVHILQDRHTQNRNQRLAYREEIAGFIACCWYHRLHYPSFEVVVSGLRMAPHVRSAYEIAWRAAEEMINKPHLVQVPDDFVEEMTPHILHAYRHQLDEETVNTSSGI